MPRKGVSSSYKDSRVSSLIFSTSSQPQSDLNNYYNITFLTISSLTYLNTLFISNL